MSLSTIKTTGKALEATRELLLLTSMLMADIEKHLPVGRRSKHTKRYLEINLRLVTSEHEQAINELTEQLRSLQALAQVVGGQHG